MIERIEIYKGVVPITFGADALGGAINVITRKADTTTAICRMLLAHSILIRVP